MEFNDWVRAWFDHPDNWNYLSDCSEDDELEDIMHLANILSPVETVDHATHLFENAGDILHSYRDLQVAHGLNALINEINSPLYALRDPLVSGESSCRCLRAIFTVHKEIFTTRCTESLGHRSEKMSDLNGICYMWWDIFPAYGGCLSEEQNKAVFDVLEQALALPNAGCQESALHGLGHWHHYSKKPVERIIDFFLASGNARRPELLRYATSARVGSVV